MRWIGLLCCLFVAAGASAAIITLDNADIETNASGTYGDIDFWGPNGGWAPHSAHPAPGNGALGLNFGFYSVDNEETVGQVTAELFQAGFAYTFSGYAQGGGNNVGTVPYQIGYVDTPDDLSTFVELATQSYNVGSDWEQLAGVSYTAVAAGPEIGKQLAVRLGPIGTGESADDVWFDSLTAEVVPEPASIALLGLGAAALLRRRRG